MSKEKKRLEVYLKTPNPMLSSWIDSWLREAENGSETQQVLKLAKESLSRYPLPIKSGKECAILRGFGKDLCEHIDKKMQAINKLTNATDSFEHQIDEVVKMVKTKPASKKVVKKKTAPIKVPTTIDMDAGSFRIFLLVDTAETSGNLKSHLDQTREFLKEFGTTYEVRRLTVGDFAWVARNTQGQELVLPFIVERKRLDDLACSIRDGRFHEQKHRLKNCGLEHVIYLIEDCNMSHATLPPESLQQAIVNTQIHSNFQTVYTKDHRETICYLDNLTRNLIKHFHTRSLHTSSLKSNSNGCYGLLEFDFFYKDSARNSALTVRELFIQQLLQLHSLSIEKASAIISKYPTPRLLIEALRQCPNETEAVSLLANIRYGQLMHPMGQKTSQTLYDFYFKDF